MGIFFWDSQYNLNIIEVTVTFSDVMKGNKDAHAPVTMDSCV